MKNLLIIIPILFALSISGQQNTRNITIIAESDFQSKIGTIDNNNLSNYDYYLIYKSNSELKIVGGLPAVGVENNSNSDVFVILRNDDLSDLSFVLDHSITDPSNIKDFSTIYSSLEVIKDSKVILEIK